MSLMMQSIRMRVTLIHAMRASIGPIESAFADGWPEAELQHLLDESLSADLARSGCLDGRMTDRLRTLARYGLGCGAEAVLFTCSAFGPCIEVIARELAPVPIRGPAQAMIAKASATGGRVGLVATFGPTLATLPSEFPRTTHVVPILAEGALDALRRGDAALHDELVAEAAARADVDVIAIAQYSAARAARAAAARTGRPVLTTPGAAVEELRSAFPRSGTEASAPA